MNEGALEILAADAADAAWIAEESAALGGPRIVSFGRLCDLREERALVCRRRGERVGFAVHRGEAATVELLALMATEQRAGVGSALLAALESLAAAENRRRLRLCTTNDNLDALRFYQRRGFRLAALRPGGFRAVLEMKGVAPSEPVAGLHGVPIRDILELEKAIPRPRRRAG